MRDYSIRLNTMSPDIVQDSLHLELGLFFLGRELNNAGRNPFILARSEFGDDTT